MDNPTNRNNGARVTAWCYPFLLLGPSRSQLTTGLVGLLILLLVFGNHPNTNYNVEGRAALVAIWVVVMAFAAGCIYEAGKMLRILNGGEIVQARLCKNKPGRAGDDWEYRLTFEYSTAPGPSRRFEVVSERDILVVGESYFFLINPELRLGVVEPDLPGGIHFANVFGLAPVPGTCWIRIMVIPVLSLVPLLGLIGWVSTAVQQATLAIGLPVLYWWTMILQIIWFVINRRYFSPTKAFEMEGGCDCPKSNAG